MGSTSKLITAPFISVRRDGEEKWLVRLDPQRNVRTSTKASPLVLAILGAFASPATTTSVVQKLSREHKGEAVLSALETLRHQDLLLNADGLTLLPPSVELEVTNRCNADCVMCPREELRPLGSMDDETFDAVKSFISCFECQGVLIQGIGEPTLHRNLISQVRQLREVLGDDKPVAVVTNGFKMRPAYLTELRDAGLTYLQWSFHAAEEVTYNGIMGVNRYGRVRENLEACAREHADVIHVNAVIMDVNRGAVGELRSTLERFGIPASHLRLIPVFSRGGLVNVSRLASGTEPRSTGGRCIYVKKAMFIAWNGDILPCSNDIEGVAVRGNIRDMRPGDILAGWRDELVASLVDFPMCPGCDHLTRGSTTLETEWYEHIAGRPIIGREKSLGTVQEFAPL